MASFSSVILFHRCCVVCLFFSPVMCIKKIFTDMKDHQPRPYVLITCYFAFIIDY